MSSAGRVPAWVIEKQRREIELARETKRREAVKVKIAELCKEIDGEITTLASTGGAAWVHKEIKGALDIRESARNVDEADVDDRFSYMLFSIIKAKFLEPGDHFPESIWC